MASQDYTNEDLKRDMRILKWENGIQTIAVIAFFFFGIATIKDLAKKAK